MTRPTPDPIQPNETSPLRKPPVAGGLYLVATPIGNARDITLRALDMLREADIVACEDTRLTRGLLALHGIERPLLSYNDHNAAAMRPRLLAALAAGQVVALASDAGLPLIADPGFRLVQEALAQAIPVSSLPGASAGLTALQLSGLPSDRFYFAGFLPSKGGERRRSIAALAAIDATLIIYEAPHRLGAALADLAALLGPRSAAVARELTKLYEEVRRGTLADLAAHYATSGAPRGEIVLVVAPPQPAAAGPDDAGIAAALAEALRSASVRDAADEVAARFGLPRRQVYAQALALRRTAGSAGDEPE